ncbi:MAG: hypothetical protein CMA77_05540 [Euryarchaeota archaeon]|nr:hypothetical protein [Euryarchaeota archaeon]|tara:strand:- start:4 stop:300 length:297 start_codon:yes stop_codon:yes gene_type:complete
MGRMEERLKKAIAKTAQDAKKKVQELSINPKSSKYVAPHRHCVICYIPIAIESEPPICTDSSCSEKHASKERSRKRLNIMLYLFPAIAIMLFLLPLFT